MMTILLLTIKISDFNIFPHYHELLYQNVCDLNSYFDLEFSQQIRLIIEFILEGKAKEVQTCQHYFQVNVVKLYSSSQVAANRVDGYMPEI